MSMKTLRGQPPQGGTPTSPATSLPAVLPNLEAGAGGGLGRSLKDDV